MLFFVYWAAGNLFAAYKFDKVNFRWLTMGKRKEGAVTFSAQIMK